MADDNDKRADDADGYLSAWRGRRELAGRNRMDRMDRLSGRNEGPTVAPKGFETLVEYRKVLAQKAIGAMAGVANPFTALTNGRRARRP